MKITTEQIRKIFNEDKYIITGTSDKTIILQNISNRKLILICSDNFYNNFYNNLYTDHKNKRKNCRIFHRLYTCIYLPQYVIINRLRKDLINKLLND